MNPSLTRHEPDIAAVRTTTATHTAHRRPPRLLQRRQRRQQLGDPLGLGQLDPLPGVPGATRPAWTRSGRREILPEAHRFPTNAHYQGVGGPVENDRMVPLGSGRHEYRDCSMMEYTTITRRRLLGNTARLTAAAFASTVLPPNVRRALRPSRLPRLCVISSTWSSS